MGLYRDGVELLDFFVFGGDWAGRGKVGVCGGLRG